MRVLLLPGSNALSHMAKCLGVRTLLERRGHHVTVAASRRGSAFLDQIGVPHVVLPDIQEADLGSSPSIAWFKRPERLEACVQSEIALIRRIEPDRIVGVFRFTAGVSARVTRIPFDALLCGCMLPQCRLPLGFAPGEAGAEKQIRYLRVFQDLCAPRVNRTLERYGLAPVQDIRELLVGDRTFLWDPEEFFPFPVPERTVRIGPSWWDGWPREEFKMEDVIALGPRIAVLSLGTGGAPAQVVDKLLPLLVRMGYGVVVAGGGSLVATGAAPAGSPVVGFRFASLQDLLPRASLLVCHGGQSTVFEGLRHRVPIVVMPLQPEQAHNGVCLERIGCGARLVPPTPCTSDPYPFLRALGRMRDEEIAGRIRSLVESAGLGDRLGRFSAVMAGYDGGTALLRFLEEEA